jgi:hypothetical protein
MFSIIENKKAIKKTIAKKDAYSIPRKRRANKKPFTILMNLNILNMLLNSKRGAKRMIPCPKLSLLLASHEELLSI